MSKIRILTPEDLAARDQDHPHMPTLQADKTAARQPTSRTTATAMSAAAFDQLYPNIAFFVKEQGWIEFGRNDDIPLTSFIRALDIGGMIWEGEDDYPSLDAAFQDLEQELGEWMRDEGIIKD